MGCSLFPSPRVTHLQEIPAVTRKTIWGNKVVPCVVYAGGDRFVKRKRLSDQNEMMAFDQAVLPHLDAAYNLARWLTRNDQDAEDIVQETCLRAFKYWKGFSGRDCRSWLLAIVRNTFYSWLRKRSVQPVLTDDGDMDDTADSIPDPESALIQNVDRNTLRAALEGLAEIGRASCRERV